MKKKDPRGGPRPNSGRAKLPKDKQKIALYTYKPADEVKNAGGKSEAQELLSRLWDEHFGIPIG